MRRIIGQLHLWLGLALCLPFVILGLTGSILVFEDELRDFFTSAIAPHSSTDQPHPASAIIAAAQTTAPNGFVPILYMAPPDSAHPATVRLMPTRSPSPGMDALQIAVDPYTLTVTAERQPDFLRQLFFLHSTLLLKNRTGRQLAGWLAVAMLAMGISGLVNWWPRRRRWRTAFTVSRQARGYVLLRELHGVTGIWGLAVFVTVSFGGVDLAFPDTVQSLVAAVLPARDLRAAAAAVRVEPAKGKPPLGIDQSIASAEATAPQATLRSVSLPRKPDQPYRIALLHPGQDWHAVPVQVIVDPWAARPVEILDPRNFSLGETLLAWQHAVHSGRGLGRIWKLLVALCGLLPLLFTVSGFFMWRQKRRRTRPDELILQVDLDQAYTARRAGE